MSARPAIMKRSSTGPLTLRAVEISGGVGKFRGPCGRSQRVDKKRKHRQDDVMKTTLDLPNDLVREIKLRAAREGRKVREVAADLLRAALAPSAETKSHPAPPLAKTLPTIGASSAPSERAAILSAQEFCDWVKQADVDLELERYEKALGHQHLDRAQS